MHSSLSKRSSFDYKDNYFKRSSLNSENNGKNFNLL